MSSGTAASLLTEELPAGCAPGQSGTPPGKRGSNEGVAPAACDSEKIRRILGAIVRISLTDEPLEAQLGQILDLIFSVPWLALEAKGAIFLVEQEPEVLVMKAHRNLDEHLLRGCERVPFGRCLCGRAASSAAVQYAGCVDERHEVRYEPMAPHGHYVVPIVNQGSVHGVLYLYLHEGHPRDPDEEEFLRIVADLLSGILQQKKTLSRLHGALATVRKTLGAVAQAMGATLETRDPYTAGHQRRVADLARAIATEMGLPRDQVEAVRMAGTIHDIGKISVPSEILCKPGRLSETELELIRVHPKVGYAILRGIEFPWPIAQVVLQHHERLDGSGYPAGLCGEHMLLEAKIVAVADVVEAMSSHRPYRAALGQKEALAEVTRNKGTLYDAAGVDACLRLFQEKGYGF